MVLPLFCCNGSRESPFPAAWNEMCFSIKSKAFRILLFSRPCQSLITIHSPGLPSNLFLYKPMLLTPKVSSALIHMQHSLNVTDPCEALDSLDPSRWTSHYILQMYKGSHGSTVSPALCFLIGRWNLPLPASHQNSFFTFQLYSQLVYTLNTILVKVGHMIGQN